MMPCVLIINDDPKAAWFAESALGDKCYVKSSADGVEGLNSIKMDPPDLVLLNIKMPRADGIWFLNQLKALELYIPIIIMTFHEYEYARELTKGHAIAGYIIGGYDETTIQLEAYRVLGLKP